MSVPAARTSEIGRPDSPHAPETLARPGLERRAEALAIVAAALFAIVFWVRLPGRLPSEADYQSLGRAISAEARPGDGVAFAPAWAERGKLFVGGLPTVTLPDLALEPEAERYARLWLIAEPDLPRSDAAATLRALDARLARTGEPRRFGPLSLSLYAPREGRRTRTDFVAQLGEATVSIRGAPPERCEAAPDGSGFLCPRGRWSYVRPEWHEFDFLARRCLWAHPVGPEPLELRFPKAELAHGFRGGMGLVGTAADSPNLAPVELAFLVDGAPAATLTLSPGQPGFHPFEIDLPGLVAGPHDVALRIATPNPAMRHFCFDAVAF